MIRLLARRGGAAALVLGVVASSLVFSASPAAAAGARVTGGGGSFPQLMFEQWHADVARPPYGLAVDYQAAGSTFGRQKYIAGQLDYGVTDIPFQPEEMSSLQDSGRDHYVYVGVTAGGLGFMYSVVGLDGNRINNVKLSPANVCRLFTDPNMYWDDDAVKQENPDLATLLPHRPVRRVARSDGSATSFMLSEYCIATAPAIWAAFVQYIKTSYLSGASVEFLNGAPTSSWPSIYDGLATAFASDGVANYVANGTTGQDTVTYVEAGFAKERRLPVVSVQNAAGIYMQPTAPAVTAALAHASPHVSNGVTDGTFQMDYLTPDAAAYYPSSYSYVVAQTDGFDPAKGATLATFLAYAVTKGQASAEELGYARLSSQLVLLALSNIAQIPGASLDTITKLENAVRASSNPSSFDANVIAQAGDATGAGSSVAARTAAAAKSAAAIQSAARNGGGSAVGSGPNGAAPSSGVAESAASGAPAAGYQLKTADIASLAKTAKVASRPRAIDNGEPISNAEGLGLLLAGLVGCGLIVTAFSVAPRVTARLRQ